MENIKPQYYLNYRKALAMIKIQRHQIETMNVCIHINNTFVTISSNDKLQMLQ